jgi:S1-C subfamily serine protease
MSESVLSKFSDELATAAEQAGRSVVSVRARMRVPSSGIVWRKGVIVTANHTVRRESEISVLLPNGKRAEAKLAGRDSGTDLAILKVEGLDAPVAQVGDTATLKLANFVLALGRTRSGNLVASAGIIGGLSGEQRTWRDGRLDQGVRLDLALYAGFSGGPLVGLDGKILGVNTSGLGRGRAMTVPLATVERSVNELLETGYIARPYLGIAMQPVSIPENVRGKIKSAPQGGLMVMHVEAGGPAEKAGIVLGDVIVELKGKPVLETEGIRDVVSAAKVGEKLNLAVLRSGSPLEVTVVLAERPVK